MKLTDLIKDSASNYEEVAKHLNGAARLTGALLADLKDTVFAGPNRTFPIHDAAHGIAVKALLALVEESDAKTTLLDSVEELVTGLVPVVETPVVVAPVVDAAVVPVAETVSKADYDLLKVEADKVADLMLDRDLWKQKATSLKNEAQAAQAAHADTMKAYKKLLADSLADAQIARGFKIEDRASTVETFLSRSIESLTTSLKDFISQEKTGVARVASGEKVENPLTTDSTTDSRKYAGIISQYWDRCYGPGGPRSADMFLADAVAKGLIPANVKP